MEAESVRETCVLRFRTSLQKQKVLRINDPSSALNRNDVVTFAGPILGAPIFDNSVGILEELVGAERVTVRRTPLL